MSQILSKMSSEKTDLTVFVVVPVEGEGRGGYWSFGREPPGSFGHSIRHMTNPFGKPAIDSRFWACCLKPYGFDMRGGLVVRQGQVQQNVTGVNVNISGPECPSNEATA